MVSRPSQDTKTRYDLSNSRIGHKIINRMYSDFDKDDKINLLMVYLSLDPMDGYLSEV